jgi:hypothetical protein
LIMMVMMIPVVVEMRILEMGPKSSHLKQLSVGDVARHSSDRMAC